jgi:hypothetical protein
MGKEENLINAGVSTNVDLSFLAFKLLKAFFLSFCLFVFLKQRRCFFVFLSSTSLELHSNLNSCQIDQLNHAILCINNFLSCQLHIFFIRHFNNIQKGNETCRCICYFILDFSCSSSMAKSAPKSASKILDTFQLFCMIWGLCLSPHLRAPHNNMPYIRHYFPPQVMVSSRRIKLKENPFQKLSFFLQ